MARMELSVALTRGPHRSPALSSLAGKSALAGEGVADAPRGGGPDALVDGQGLAQERGALVVVAVLEAAVAGSF